MVKFILNFSVREIMKIDLLNFNPLNELYPMEALSKMLAKKFKIIFSPEAPRDKRPQCHSHLSLGNPP